MVINLKRQKELKKYMGMQGTGAKGKLAELLEINPSQVSILLSAGIIPESKFERLKEILSDKPLLGNIDGD